MCIAVHAVLPSRGRGGVTTNTQTKAWLVGSKALTNCLANPSLICNGGSKILVLSIRDEFRALWEPDVRSLRAGQVLTK